MDFKTFSREFMNIGCWNLDSSNRYYIENRPLRLYDGEIEQYTKKFTSLKEMWDYCYDGEHKVSDALANLEAFELWFDE